MHLNDEFVDLIGQSPVQVPNELRADYVPRLLLSADRKQIQNVVYASPAYAMADIAYSRLSRLLALPCVEARFGINFQLAGAHKYVSVTPYDPDWITYENWKEQHPDQELANQEEYDHHKLLTEITQKTYWHGACTGYVTTDNNFVKSNNGDAFFSSGLEMFLKGDSTFRQLIDTPDDIAYKSCFDAVPLSRSFIKKVAALSDDQLSYCYDFPQTPEYIKGKFWFSGILASTREAAQKYLQS